MDIKTKEDAKYGDWVIERLIPEDDEVKLEGIIDNHTHGLEKYGLKNLAMFLKLDVDETELIMDSIAWLMIQGETFDTEHKQYLEFADGSVYDFFLDEIKWHGEDVLRIILSDPECKFYPIDGEVTKEKLPYIYQQLSPTILARVFDPLYDSKDEQYVGCDT